MEQMIFDHILEDLVLQECLNINFAIRCGQFPLEKVPKNVTVAARSAQETSTKKDKIATQEPLAQPKLNQTNVYCPICNFPISGQRFAPHLEKCLRGGKRGAKTSSSSSSSSSSYALSSLPYYPKPKKVFVDAFPDSRIIKIKLKNGVPRANQTREGVSEQYFLDSQKEKQETTSAVTSLNTDLVTRSSPLSSSSETSSSLCSTTDVTDTGRQVVTTSLIHVIDTTTDQSDHYDNGTINGSGSRTAGTSVDEEDDDDEIVSNRSDHEMLILNCEKNELDNRLKLNQKRKFLDININSSNNGVPVHSLSIITEGIYPS